MRKCVAHSGLVSIADAFVASSVLGSVDYPCSKLVVPNVGMQLEVNNTG